MPSLDTTNMWLAILATAAAIQTILFVCATVALFVLYRRTAAVLEALEQRHLVPMTARMTRLFDDFDDMSARARRVDDNVREGVKSANSLLWALASKAWPVLGAASAVRAGLRVIGERMGQSNGEHSGRSERRREHVS